MAKSLDLKKRLEKHQADLKAYKRTPEEKATIDFVEERKSQMQKAREESKIESIWKAADKAYVPHEVTAKKGRKIFASDDEEGLRSSQITLGREDAWQEDSVPVNPYIKIQTALGIIVDNNPTAVMNPGAKKYTGNTKLMENLYKRSWDIASSRSACLKPFVFNAAKYGIGVGRTFPLRINGERRNGSKYVRYDDVFRESLSPWQVWFDESGKVGNPLSFNDSIYYKDYSWDKLVEQFGHLDNFKYIKPQAKQLTEERKLELYTGGNTINSIAKIQERIWFYENIARDLFCVYTDDGLPLVISSIPKSDENMMGSVWFAPWTLRDDSTPNGIGVYESMRNDHKLHMKIRNMTMDQLVLSVYREWFYEGTDTLQGDGSYKTRPGAGRQVTNPQNIRWNEIPSPGQEAWKGIEYQEQKIDESSGVTKGLTGEVTGSTAYETAQARESALKRLKTPLENITAALEQDAYITLAVMEDLYGAPKIKLVAEDRYIEAAELKDMADEEGNVPEYEEEYREIPANLEEDEDGNIIETDQEKFYTLNPDKLPWKGTIKIKGQSIIASSELLERVSTVEMANIIIPLFAQPPELVEKPAREIIKSYDKDPEDWLPDIWLNPPAPAPQVPGAEGALPLFVDAATAEQGTEDPLPGSALGGEADRVVPEGNGKGNSISNILNSIKQVK